MHTTAVLLLLYPATPTIWGVPNTLEEQGTKSEVGPQVGGLATSPLPSGEGSPTLQNGGRNQKRAHKWVDWLHHPCRLGGPNASQQGTKSEVGPQVGRLATSPQPSGGSPTLQGGGNQKRAHKWADWLHHPCCLGGGM